MVPLGAALAGRNAAEDESTQSIGAALAEASQHRGFWLLTGSFFVCGFQTIFVMTHLPAYLVDRGLSPDQGMTALAVIGLFNIVGSYGCGALGARYSKRLILAWIYVIRALAIAAFLAAPLTPAGTYLFAAVLGLTWLGTVPLTNSLVGQIFGVKYLSTLFSISFLGHQLGAFLGAWAGRRGVRCRRLLPGGVARGHRAFGDRGGLMRPDRRARHAAPPRSDVKDENPIPAQTQRLASLGFMLASVCHEVSNPLAAVSSMLQILQSKRGVTPETLEKGLASIEGNVARVLAITKKLGDYSRVGGEPPAPLAIDDAVEAATALLRHSSSGHDVQVDYRGAPGVAVLARPGELEQVVFNVFLNAAQAMAGVGRIEARARAANGAGRAVDPRQRARHPQRTTCRACSTRSSPPSSPAKAPAWASPSATRSCTSSAAASTRRTIRTAARASRSCCRHESARPADRRRSRACPR